MRELADAEFWLLLSLDAESALHELLMPIVQFDGGRERQTRPSLAIPEAAQALASLATRGLVEVRALAEGVYDWDEGRVVTAADVQAIADDQLNWRVPSEEPVGRDTYWAAATAEGEAAYSEATGARQGEA